MARAALDTSCFDFAGTSLVTNNNPDADDSDIPDFRSGLLVRLRDLDRHLLK
jgi:hypothetical protein